MHFYLCIPFVEIQTAIMRHCDMHLAYEYLSVRIRVWKYHFEFAVGDKLLRMMKKRKKPPETEIEIELPAGVWTPPASHIPKGGELN